MTDDNTDGHLGDIVLVVGAEYFARVRDEAWAVIGVIREGNVVGIQVTIVWQRMMSTGMCDSIAVGHQHK
jgi:hypothetical protein